MTLELPRPERDRAVASIERWFAEHRDERIGNVTAGALLGFFLEEIGPTLYNQALADVQARLESRLTDLGYELEQPPSTYWDRHDRARRGRR